jgi:hypothetical protein
MATERQLQLEQALRCALKELGTGVSTEFLIATTSERTKADPGEIIEAVKVLNRRLERQGSDEGTGGDATTLLLALGKAVIAIWSNLSQDVQHELFEHAVSLKMTRRESDWPFSCMQYTFARLMRSRPAPSRNPTVLGDNGFRSGAIHVMPPPIASFDEICFSVHWGGDLWQSCSVCSHGRTFHIGTVHS